MNDSLLRSGSLLPLIRSGADDIVSPDLIAIGVHNLALPDSASVHAGRLAVAVVEAPGSSRMQDAQLVAVCTVTVGTSVGMTTGTDKIEILRVDVGVRDGGSVGSSDASDNGGVSTGGSRNSRGEAEKEAGEFHDGGNRHCERLVAW